MSKLLESLFHYNDKRINPHSIKANDFSNETEYLTNVKFVSHIDEKGNTIYKDTPPFSFADIQSNIETMDLEIAMEYLREKRNNLLKETDHFALSDQTLSDDMRTYRQSLRDLTDGLTTKAEVDAVVFPTKPGA